MAIKRDREYRRLWEAYANSGVPAGDVVGWGQQRANLETTYKDSRALLKLQRKALGESTRQQIRAIRDQGRTDVSSAAAAANDRGVLGSSQDVSTRAQIQTDTKQQVMAARDALVQGRDENIAQLMQARRDFYTGNANLAALIAAAKAAGATTNFAQGALDGMVGGGPSGGGGPGAVPLKNVRLNQRWVEALRGAKSVPELAQRIEQLKNGVFDADELENFQGQGQITAGHSDNSAHYTGDTFDVNTTRNNNTQREKVLLAQLYKALKAAGYSDYIAQAIYNEANKGPGWHGHFDFVKRSWGQAAGGSGRQSYAV